MDINNKKSNDNLSNANLGNNEIGKTGSSSGFFSKFLESQKDPVESVLEGLRYLEEVLKKTNNAKIDKSDTSIKEGQQSIEDCIAQIKEILAPAHSPPSPSSPSVKP